MGQKMANPPIFYTIAQIRFNPVLNMSEYVPKIHLALRKEFPEIRQEELRQFQLNIAATGNGEPVSSFAAPRWVLSNLKKTSGYILLNDSIAFHTAAYETSEEFSAALLRGIELVNELVGLSYVDRVGFRTLDAIIPESGRSLRYYLKNDVLGFYEMLNGELKYNVSENFTVLPSGQLVARLAILSSPSVGVPPDLFPIQLTLKQQLQGPIGLHAVLDLDHSQEDRFEFDLQEIQLRIRQLKSILTGVFRECNHAGGAHILANQTIV